MFLATPSWLWLLLPWAALVVITLRAYRRKVTVPFLDMWPTEEVIEGRRRAWRPPAAPIILLLAALLLAIAALSRPEVSSRTPRIKRITLVLDRGITMLAGDRLRQATEAAMTALMPLLDAEAEITVIDPLQGEQLVGPAALRSVISRPATAVDMRTKIAQIAGSAAKLGPMPDPMPDPRIAITDHANLSRQEGVIVVAPDNDTQNVGIVSASARGGECWLRLRNESAHPRATVLFTAGGKAIRHEMQLPARGEERSYALPCPGQLPLRIELELVDDLADDNIWWIMPELVAARIAVGQGLPEWARRFAQSYARANPPGELSQEVQITAAALPGWHNVTLALGEEQLSLPAEGLIPDHPLLAHVVLPSHIRGGTALPPGDWQILLEAGGRPILAVNDLLRKVWIGFRPDGEITPDYLILLSNAVDFSSGVVCRIGAPGLLDGRWIAMEGPAKMAGAAPGMRAGLYDNDNSYLAINAPAPQLGQRSPQGNTAAELTAIAARSSRVALGEWLWIGAAALVTAAAAAIRPPSRLGLEGTSQNRASISAGDH